ncbi:hypothetical protein N9L68_02050 [bacterium]|nr:hypothetical protein [bacterium]
MPTPCRLPGDKALNLWRVDLAWLDAAGAARDAGSSPCQFPCVGPREDPGDEHEVRGLSVISDPAVTG